jgi:hypothetical protein
MVFEDVLVNPFAVHATGRLSPLDARRATIQQVTIREADLQAFLKEQKGFTTASVKLEPGALAFAIGLPGPDVARACSGVAGHRSAVRAVRRARHRRRTPGARAPGRLGGSHVGSDAEDREPAAVARRGGNASTSRPRPSESRPDRKGSAMRETRDAKRARAKKIVRLLKKAYPDAKIALNFGNPLELLVATILSAQCTDDRVNLVTPALFKKYASASDYARAPAEDLEEAVRSTGFYRAKTRSIIAMAKALGEKARRPGAPLAGGAGGAAGCRAQDRQRDPGQRVR